MSAGERSERAAASGATTSRDASSGASGGEATVRVALPPHLCGLAELEGREASLTVHGPVTARAVLDALETRHPALRGTIREHRTKRRRAFVRFFACGEDWSHEDPDAPLPDVIASGKEPFTILGAMAGG